MAENVLIDPQYSMIQVLKPVPTFEALYQGQLATIPIAFPGGLDPRAGDTGFDPALMAGIKVPKGARIQIWFPTTLYDYEAVFEYEYQVNWRYRSAGDFNEDIVKRRAPATPYHLPFQQTGYPNVPTVGADSPRVFIPGAVDSILYEQAEPSGSDAGVINLRGQRYRPSSTPTTLLPLVAAGTSGCWQQGTYQSLSTQPNVGGPSYFVVDLEAAGDEMSIWAFKIEPEAEETWDFTFAGDDRAFAETYGDKQGQLVQPRIPSEFVGILVTSGVSI